MEATKEDAGFLNNLIPPRLEDAGLEDCALPPESIKEAFLKAASAVKSQATSFFHDEDDDDCLDDPWPKPKDVSDTLVGVSPPPDTPGPCGVVKGGGVVEKGEDKVVVGGGDDVAEGNDEVVVVGDDDGVAEGKGGSGCVEGLKGLSIQEKEKKKKEGKESERPTLVEGFV